MTTTAEDHYANHLGPIYSWMVGNIDAALARSESELHALSLPSATAGRVSAGTAIDLGAGFGLHAIPLARRGFNVIAIDSNGPLLEECCRRGLIRLGQKFQPILFAGRFGALKPEREVYEKLTVGSPQYQNQLNWSKSR